MGRARNAKIKGRERSDFVPKGLEDSARGFNPGIDQSKTNPPRRGGRGLVAIYAPINSAQNRYLPPLQHPQPAMRVQFGQGAVLQQFAKPTPLFEHEHEDDFDAPCEGGAVFLSVPGVKTPGLVL
jgi:hypothetical protein